MRQVGRAVDAAPDPTHEVSTHALGAPERAGEREEGGAGEVEVGEEGVDDPESVSRLD